jgi:hypothetical protein
MCWLGDLALDHTNLLLEVQDAFIRDKDLFTDVDFTFSPRGDTRAKFRQCLFSGVLP